MSPEKTKNEVQMGQLDASLYSKLASDLGITGKIFNCQFDCKKLHFRISNIDIIESNCK